MRVLVCGSRDWADAQAVMRVLDELPREGLTIIEGCARGVDNYAELWARSRRVLLEHYPADWAKFGRAAGPMRNARMLTMGQPDLVIAFHKGDSRGTADMIGRAKRAGVPTRVLTP